MKHCISRKSIIAIIVASISPLAIAEGLIVTTKIQSIFLGPKYENIVFLEVTTKPSSSRPSGCLENNNFDFSLDLSTAHGKEYYSALLSAYAADRTVRLESYDNCNLYASVPQIKSIWVK